MGHPPENRWGLLISGIASAVLGVIVLFNIVTATFTLLGVLLGVQVLLDEGADAGLLRPAAGATGADRLGRRRSQRIAGPVAPGQAWVSVGVSAGPSPTPASHGPDDHEAR